MSERVLSGNTAGPVVAPEASVPIQGRSARVVTEALDRLELVATLQERGAFRKPVKLRGPRRLRLLSRFLRFVDDRLGLAQPGLPASRRRVLHASVIMAVRAATGRWGARGPGVMTLAATRARTHEELLRPPVGYVANAEEETSVVRAALLLRLLNRHAAAVRLLRRRLESGQPAEESRRWLAFLLTEVGEGKSAKKLELSALAPVTGEARRGQPYHPPRLRYGVVMTTMRDTPVFRRSLQSLLDSDFSGTVVVVEDGPSPQGACRAACDQLGVTFLKNPTWGGSAEAINRGVAYLCNDVDVAVFCHNDILWPSRWFATIDTAWSRVYDTDKVALLNLGYIQLKRVPDPALADLFLRGRYADLVWLLRAMREVPALLPDVQDAQVKAGEAPFGLARDPWVEWIPELRLQSGRFSVAASFPVHIWKEIGGFDSELSYAFDLQLLQHSVARRRWALFTNNPPLLHLRSFDTRSGSHDEQVEIGQKIAGTYEAFQRKYGWNIEHYLNLYFSESAVIHGDAIVAAANAGRFMAIDYVFDDFQARLASRRLHNCELTWCRTRGQCPYTSN